MSGEEPSIDRAGRLSPDEAREELERVRERISDVDDRLIRIIGERRDLVLAVGRLKEILGLPVLDPQREAQVVRKAAARARELGVDEEMTRDVVWRIIAAARAAQEDRPADWPERPSLPDDPGGKGGPIGTQDGPQNR